MNVKDLIRSVGEGSVTLTAARIGCSRQSIYLWRESGQVPELYRYRAQAWLQRERTQAGKRART